MDLSPVPSLDMCLEEESKFELAEESVESSVDQDWVSESASLMEEL